MIGELKWQEDMHQGLTAAPNRSFLFFLVPGPLAFFLSGCGEAVRHKASVGSVAVGSVVHLFHGLRVLWDS